MERSMWHTFGHSTYIEQKCVYAHVASLKVLNSLTALASTPSPLPNPLQPLYWKTWAPVVPDKRKVTSQPSCSSLVRPGPHCRSLGTEMTLSLSQLCPHSAKRAVCPCVPSHQEFSWDKGALPTPEDRRTWLSNGTQQWPATACAHFTQLRLFLKKD